MACSESRADEANAVAVALAGCGFFLVVAAVGPLLDSFWLSLLTLVFFYAFMGLSWNLMMSAGLLSLGHALFLGLGAYTTAVLTASGGINPWLAIPAGVIIAALAGSVIAWVGGRFSVRGVQFAVLTIAFAELVRVLFDNWDFVGGTGGLFLKAINPDTNRPLLTLRGGALFSYFAFLAITAAAYFLIQRLMVSRWGFRWRGISEDEDAARALGVPALRSKVLVGSHQRRPRRPWRRSVRLDAGQPVSRFRHAASAVH